MLTYQIRKRAIKIQSEQIVSMPNVCTINFYLEPLQPFGVNSGGGHTTVQSKGATANFDANTGKHTIMSSDPLSPLKVIMEQEGCIVTLTGALLKVVQRFETLQDLADLIETIYFSLPMLLNVVYGDPPYVARVDGLISNIEFRWELADWKMHYTITTQDKQEKAFGDSWLRINILSDPGNRRIMAALHYFHVAVRLSRSGSVPGEFLSEMILNLAKTLEVLFPPDGDGMTRDAVRVGLRSLGYEDSIIENHYIPVMSLRNNIDVGHVELALFTLDQLTTIHEYTDMAEQYFKSLFKNIFEALDKGLWEAKPYGNSKPSKDALEIINRIKKTLSD